MPILEVKIAREYGMHIVSPYFMPHDYGVDSKFTPQSLNERKALLFPIIIANPGNSFSTPDLHNRKLT